MISKEKYCEKYGVEFKCRVCNRIFYKRKKKRCGKYLRPMNSVTCSQKCARNRKNYGYRDKEYIKEYNKRPEVLKRKREYKRDTKKKRISQTLKQENNLD